MIFFEDAQKLVLDHTPIPFSVEKSIYEINSGILAEDVRAREDVPFFSNSAMDGFALRSEETQFAPVTLEIRECIKAGDSPEMKVGKGEAMTIMTGAPMPNGADAVVMVEDTEEKGKDVLVKKAIRQGENVRHKGEEIQKDQIGLEEGTSLNPASLGFLASLGREMIMIFDKPKVSVLVTGNELIKPGDELMPGKIWESNSAALNAALNEMGIRPNYMGIALDNLQDLENRIKEGLKNSDILLICGGVSVGEYDLVLEVLLKLKVKKIFWRVAIKPGKPTYFGTKGKKLIFGLPGNPASVLVTFLEFVRPAILRMMGQRNAFLREREATLEEQLQKNTERAHLLRGVFCEKNGMTYVRSAGMQCSHILDSFARANCLIFLEKEKKLFEQGERVKIQILPWM